jgi:hypothetical protein
VASFEAIPHSALMQAVEERVSDRKLLTVLRAFLRAGVMEQGSLRRSVTGTPQGNTTQLRKCGGSFRVSGWSDLVGGPRWAFYGQMRAFLALSFPRL